MIDNSTLIVNDLENTWRSLILYGKNVATYKFALGKTLLYFAPKQISKVKLDDLSNIYSSYLCEHVKSGKSQITSPRSSFLDACSAYNNNDISKETLIDETKKNGFKFVLDAFHVLGSGQTQSKFYHINGSGNKREIILSDNLFYILNTIQFKNLESEIEARWCLVEDAWTFGTGDTRNPVLYDSTEKILYANEPCSEGIKLADISTYRRNLTKAKSALIGYQKGKCFYCFDNILADNELNCDVDHFIPFTLRYKITNVNLNSIWNLVLSCSNCNRGADGKFHHLPSKKYLERLLIRNNYLVNSNHPLSNTIKNQTGNSNTERNKFIIELYTYSINIIKTQWEPIYEYEFNF